MKHLKQILMTLVATGFSASAQAYIKECVATNHAESTQVTIRDIYTSDSPKSRTEIFIENTRTPYTVIFSEGRKMVARVGSGIALIEFADGSETVGELKIGYVHPPRNLLGKHSLSTLSCSRRIKVASNQ